MIRNTRDALAELIWTTSRNDEGTISATGANIVADAILAAGWTPPPRTAQSLPCPACQALAGRPCTIATDTGRRSVLWYHEAREGAFNGS